MIRHTKHNSAAKKLAILFLAAVLLLSLAGCVKYVSKYSAVGFVHSNNSSSAYMYFYSFNGRMVFKLKSSGNTALQYSAKLESGSAEVSCECGGIRTELFSLRGGDEIDSQSGCFESGTIYVIVETDGKCLGGDIRFNLE